MTAQGVNIGGWLIPENWLTPSLFSNTGAEDLDTLLRSDTGRERYKTHLDTFITESDFQWLADQGVAWIRIPVGYWAIAADGVYPSTKAYLDWAMNMAKKYGIQVLIDLHAAKGSQNGTVHSGKIGQIQWQHRKQYRDETRCVLVEIAKRYRDSPVFWGIELLNEPKLGWSYFTLLRFYRQAYRDLQKVLRPGTYTVFHDAFWAPLFTGALRKKRGYPVAMDVHLYLLPAFFAPSLSRYLWWQNVTFRTLLWLSSRAQPVILGEWSSVLPQKLFNQTPTEDHARLLRENIVNQQAIYQSTLVQCYWNYKAEGDGMWNFKSLVERGDLVIK